MTVIRKATHEDIPAILRMGLEFFNAAGWPKYAEWHEASVDCTLRSLIDGKIPGGLLAAEKDGNCVGMAGYLVFPCYFNFAAKMAQEIFLWLDPAHRGPAGIRMLERIEHDAREQGAQVIVMANVSGMRGEAVGKMYERRGYSAAESTWIKRL